MNADAVQQLVHGYAHGHTLLAASVALADPDLDLVARLSDLSGSMGGGLSMGPYLTLYPLPSRRWYVVAKTWLDEEIARTGCVLTQSLLVPMEIWARDASPGRFFGALQKPNRQNLKESSNPPYIPASTYSKVVSDPRSRSFIQKFFGEGLTPLAWFDAVDPEALTEQILIGLWPSIRSRFSACTFALQPRTLQDRLFDLHFSVSEAFSRFGDFSREHLVDERQSTGLSSLVEPWISALTQDIFGPLDDARRKRMRELTDGLAPYPTSVRQVYFLLELEGRISTSPMAAVGALDLLNAIAPTPEEAQEAKERVAASALDAIATEEPTRALEVLYLLSQRLDSPSTTLSMKLSAKANGVTRDALLRTGEGGIKIAAGLIDRHRPTMPSFFLTGIAEGTGRLLDSNADIAQVLLSYPLLGEFLLPLHLDLVEKFLNKVPAKERGRGVFIVVGWLHVVQDAELRKELRRRVFPVVKRPEDAPLLEEVLRDIGDDEIDDVCSRIEAQETLRTAAYTHIVCRLVGERHPQAVFVWSSTNEWSSFQLAQVVASGLSMGADGLSKVFETTLLDDQRALMVGAFVSRACTRSIPSWLAVSLETSSRIWELLLLVYREQEVRETIAKIIRALPRLACARAANARSVIASSERYLPEGFPCIAVKQLIYDFLEGHTNSEQLALWMAETWMPPAMGQLEPGALGALVRQCISRSDLTWLRVWTLLDCIAPEVFRRKPSIVAELISGVLVVPSVNWSQAVADVWVRALVAVKQATAVHRELCDQALRFSLQHSHLPLDTVVAESFFAVHDLAMSGRASKWSLWSLGEWDKAKELRQSLVEAFSHSSWRPEYFVLAAREAWLLRKLSKRMLRQWGGAQFLERARVGLRAHQNAASAPI